MNLLVVRMNNIWPFRLCPKPLKVLKSKYCNSFFLIYKLHPAQTLSNTYMGKAIKNISVCQMLSIYHIFHVKESFLTSKFVFILVILNIFQALLGQTKLEDRT